MLKSAHVNIIDVKSDVRDSVIYHFEIVGGVNVVCENLVSTNRHIINTNPSLVSSIMQYFGSTRLAGVNSRRPGTYSELPADSALQNFAPLG
jgi:baculoviral IAP repeat-containing protein 6